jgi:hypothetical protein
VQVPTETAERAVVVETIEAAKKGEPSGGKEEASSVESDNA